jgi:hypothetical protein
MNAGLPAIDPILWKVHEIRPQETRTESQLSQNHARTSSSFQPVAVSKAFHVSYRPMLVRCRGVCDRECGLQMTWHLGVIPPHHEPRPHAHERI